MNSLNIKIETKIYVACPANIVTGGPELLHQLVHELNKLGFNAFMYYYNKIENKYPIDESYINYHNKFIEEIEDNKNNIIIVPEVNTQLLYEYQNIQKIIWWLSVDNYFYFLQSNTKIKKIIKSILYKIGILPNNKIYKFDKDQKIIHFVQSEYAKQLLKKKFINDIYYLSDYLNSHFIEKQLLNNHTEKMDIVIYNPKKGISFTKKLIKIAKNIKFIPIENMTREEVSELLSKAKVYIDFGNHPGKDRIPREAAISGCCVITGKNGSAQYFEDVPIPDSFKYNAIDKNVKLIIENIKLCFSNYENESKKFDLYRDIIRKEQSRFIEDITSIFGK